MCLLHRLRIACLYMDCLSCFYHGNPCGTLVCVWQIYLTLMAPLKRQLLENAGFALGLDFVLFIARIPFHVSFV